MNTMEFIINTLQELVNIPSPSGYTKEIMEYVSKKAEGFGYAYEYSKKGGLIILVPGKEKETLGLSAHVDTLGAMVRSVSANGMLKFTMVGGFTMHSIEGCYCKIHTREGMTYTGTILSKSPSVHTFDDARTLERSEKNMEIRIDEQVKNKDEVLALGINTGDYISLKPVLNTQNQALSNPDIWTIKPL